MSELTLILPLVIVLALGLVLSIVCIWHARVLADVEAEAERRKASRSSRQ